MFNENHPNLDDNYALGDDSSNKKQIIGGLAIIAVIILVVGGFIYLDKKGGGLSFLNNEDEFDSVKDLYKDSDGDGLTDDLEELYGTDKNNTDTDGDGYSDYEEIEGGYNPKGDGKLTEEAGQVKAVIEEKKQAAKINSNETWKKLLAKRPRSDGGFNTLRERAADADGDGLSNIIEQAYGLDPRNPDTDGDGRSDRKELKNFENPLGSGMLPREVVVTINNAEKYMLFYDQCAKSIGRDSDSDGMLDKCYRAAAILTNKTSYCDKAKRGEYNGRGDCYTSLAIINIDEKYCEKIPENTKDAYFDKRGPCFEKLIAMKKDYKECNSLNITALAQMNGKYTPRMKTRRYDCYVATAINGQPETCEKMKSNYKTEYKKLLTEANLSKEELLDSIVSEKAEDVWYECYAATAVNGPTDLCDKKKYDLKIEYKKSLIKLSKEELIDSIISEKTENMRSYDTCLKNLAIFYEDAAACEDLKSIENRDLCYYGIAIANNDYNLCGEIKKEDITHTPGKNGKLKRSVTSPKKKDKCYAKIGEKLNDASICDMASRQSYKDACYESVGKNNNDVPVCNKIINKNKKDNCFSEIAINLNDIDLCYNIKNEALHDQCIDKLISEQSDSSVCGKIFRDGYRDLCFRDLAQLKKDYKICDNIKNYTIKDLNYSCYGYVALKSLDENICDLIPLKHRKNGCYSSLAIEKNDKNICDKIIKDSEDLTKTSYYTKERCYAKIK